MVRVCDFFSHRCSPQRVSAVYLEGRHPERRMGSETGRGGGLESVSTITPSVFL
jgi:hypothetical protein